MGKPLESWVSEGYQPKGNYLTEVPSGYATEEFVKNILILPFVPSRDTNLGHKVNVAGDEIQTTNSVYLAKYGSRERILFKTFIV